jgi:hypothetical protein
MLAFLIQRNRAAEKQRGNKSGNSLKRSPRVLYQFVVPHLCGKGLMNIWLTMMHELFVVPHLCG